MLPSSAIATSSTRKTSSTIIIPTSSVSSITGFQRTTSERSHTGCCSSHNNIIPTDEVPLTSTNHRYFDLTATSTATATSSVTYKYLVRNRSMLPSNQQKQQQRQQIDGGGRNTPTGSNNLDDEATTHKRSDNTVTSRTRRVSDASNSNIAIIPPSLLQHPTQTPGVATNVILKEEDQGRMRKALEFIEEARDMEQYNYYDHHRRYHSSTTKADITDEDDFDDEDDAMNDDEQEDSSSHYEFQLLQEEKQNELYKRAISIMESIVGYYHPDVSNTYHLLGWSLYELGPTGRKTASALVYLLRALRISQRLFGNDHTSTSVILDDIRDIVRCEEYKNTVLENHCNLVFDSWVYQNLAEEALLVHNDPITSLRLYKHALKMLPTEPSMMTATTATDTSTNNIKDSNNIDNSNNDSDDDDHEMLNTDDDDHHDGEIEIMRDVSRDDDDDDDDDTSITVAETINTKEYNSKDDYESICVAELERSTIQLHMAAIIHQHQLHHLSLSAACSEDEEEDKEDVYESSFDLYCKALAVLPNWLSENNPTVQQARTDVSQVAIDIAIYRYATAGGGSGSSSSNSSSSANNNSSSNNNNSNSEQPNRHRRLNSITNSNNNDIKLVLG